MEVMEDGTENKRPKNRRQTRRMNGEW